jgi:hypothetical protein
MPQNFLIDPVATSIKEALGVAIDEYVPIHQVHLAQEAGIYRQVSVENASIDIDLEPDQDLTQYTDDKVRLTKYYGKVPRTLFEGDSDEGETVEGSSEYVEAIVVIANNGILLKVEENPYMMKIAQLWHSLGMLYRVVSGVVVFVKKDTMHKST